MNKHDNIRRGLIAKIHIAKAQLGLDETAYRLLLNRHGADSASAMRLDQLEAVLQELQAKGWRPTPSRKAGKRKQASGAEVKLIRALWLFLHEIGEVGNPTEAALAAYAKRVGGIDDLHWADESRRYRIIETLKKWAARALPARLEARMAYLDQADMLPSPLRGEGPGERVRALCVMTTPTLRPDTYDALHRAWEALKEIEHGRTVA
ncbi:MAG: regulatory protein GemA [Pseudomonadota bacterium]